eukprot:TRINITY_DN6884_c0_g1_i1.p1 TRINITY_DN6884_c0_g1~~TRINITY_DN6884_c0_g1_i1.p1  ORF type:complete len:209 (+),score=40.72 TRINITY_DN6884_c0_g1_i1:412-1038(+)
MSLLEELRAGKKLQKTETVIVEKSGARYKEIQGKKIYLTKVGDEWQETDEPSRIESDFFIESPPHPELYQIGDTNIFLGAQEAATNIEDLEKNNVQFILNVATGIPNRFPDKFTYKSVEMLDNESFDIISHFETCFDFIQNALNQSSGVLVHCNAGVSRSATVIIAYLITQGTSHEEAFNIVKKSKPDINPNPHFKTELIKFAKLQIK